MPRSLKDLPVVEPTIDAPDPGPSSGGAAGRSTGQDAERSASGDRPVPADEPLWGASSTPTDAPAPRAAAPRTPAPAEPRSSDARADASPAAPAAPHAPQAASGPWWSRDAGGPPPPPAGSDPAGPIGPQPPAGARPGPPPTAGGAARPDDRTPGDPGHAPGAGGRPAAPRAAPGTPGTPTPAPREVEDWFGPDETGEHADGDDPAGDDRDRGGDTGPGGLLPLRPAGPVQTAQATPPRKPSRKERKNPGPATVHTRTAPARRGVSRIAAFLVLAIIALVIAGAVFLFQPLKGDGDGEVRVRIPPGSSVDDIGRLLKEKGVVSNALAFSIRARISGDGANLKAGTLRLKQGMSYGAALTALQQDPLPPSVVRVSIPEGLSRTEVASTIKKAGVTGSYLTASSRSTGFDPRDYGQPARRRGLEGFLFPATYELQRGAATSKALVAQQLKLFEENIDDVSMTRARRADLSVYDVLIVASMVEREVRVPSERKLVAAVIWNRLEQNIALGIDATTRYAVKNWTRPLKQSEIDSDTPYDTRYRKGLPPTPIGSPGLASIKAAANPSRSSYLYYVVRPCSDGRHNFATSNAEFEKDRAAYNAAQRRAGGDPSPKDAKGCPSR